MYDSRETLVTRLTAVRNALDKARIATVERAGDGEVQRSYTMLVQEEQSILRQINAIDARSSGGATNRVRFGRPS